VLFIVTLVMNQYDEVRRLYKEIESVEKEIGWVVVDGSASNMIQNFLNDKVTDSNIRLIYLKDDRRGIYAALNMAVLALPEDSSYVIINPDDLLFHSRMRFFLEKKFTADCIFLFPFLDSLGRKQNPRMLRHLVFCIGTRAFFSGHATAICIPRKVHDVIGLYSCEYQIASDIDFFYRILRTSVICRVFYSPVAIYDTNGISAVRSDLARRETLMIHGNYFGRFSRLLLAIKFWLIAK